MSLKTILVDDELWMLQQFREECSELPEIEIVGEFSFAQDALDYARENPVEFALLDIEMPGINGVELAKELRRLYPEMIVVFVTGHKEYLSDFIDMKADYYVLKPYGREEVRDVLDRAKLYSARLRKRVDVTTFGPFTVFVDGKPLHFSSSKAKELFALLVQKRGAVLTPQEALDSIWEGREYDKGEASVYRVTLTRLRDILEDAGIGDVLQSTPRGKYLDVGKYSCDLNDFIAGDREARQRFNGQYLPEYSWGETTLAQLMRISRGESFRDDEL
jgi:two-component SAPR family response regulator